MSSRKLTHFCQRLMKLEFCRQHYSEAQILNFMKIRRVGAELFHADRQTDRYDESNTHFLQFFERIEKKDHRQTA